MLYISKFIHADGSCSYGLGNNRIVRNQNYGKYAGTICLDETKWNFVPPEMVEAKPLLLTTPAGVPETQLSKE